MIIYHKLECFKQILHQEYEETMRNINTSLRDTEGINIRKKTPGKTMSSTTRKNLPQLQSLYKIGIGGGGYFETKSSFQIIKWEQTRENFPGNKLEPLGEIQLTYKICSLYAGSSVNHQMKRICRRRNHNGSGENILTCGYNTPLYCQRSRDNLSSACKKGIHEYTSRGD